MKFALIALIIGASGASAESEWEITPKTCAHLADVTVPTIAAAKAGKPLGMGFSKPIDWNDLEKYHGFGRLLLDMTLEAHALTFPKRQSRIDSLRQIVKFADKVEKNCLTQIK